MTLLEGFETQVDETDDVYSSTLRWKFFYNGTSSISLSNTHTTEGSNAWRLQDTNFASIASGDSGTPQSVDLTGVSTIYVDVYWAGTLDGDSPAIYVGVYNSDYVESVYSDVSPPLSGNNTLVLDVTSNPSLDLTEIYFDIGAYSSESFSELYPLDVWVDNLRSEAGGGTIIPQIMNNYRRLRS